MRGGYGVRSEGRMVGVGVRHSAIVLSPGLGIGSHGCPRTTFTPYPPLIPPLSLHLPSLHKVNSLPTYLPPPYTSITPQKVLTSIFPHFQLLPPAKLLLKKEKAKKTFHHPPLTDLSLYATFSSQSVFLILTISFVFPCTLPL